MARRVVIGLIDRLVREQFQYKGLFRRVVIAGMRGSCLHCGKNRRTVRRWFLMDSINRYRVVSFAGLARFRRSGRRLLVFTQILVHPPGGVHKFLPPSVKRMTTRANLHFEVPNRGASLEGIPTRASHRGKTVLRMNVRFQRCSF